MSQLELIDTFPAFESAWAQVSDRPIEAQIDAWERVYMAQWPELLQMQIEGHAAEGTDWHSIARQRIFPALPGRLSEMRIANGLLADISPYVFRQAFAALDLDIQAVFVLYVGIGCGAGWVTKYAGKPTILFGLENIAEEGWAFEQALRGLVAHEMGHLAHFMWLEQAGRPKGEGAWWQLFEKGFAQRCEHVILGEDTWHMALGEGVRGWLAWCREKRSWLANEYLRAIEEGWPVQEFFGSRFDILGYKRTGYYLGHEVVREIQQDKPLEEVACLPDLEARVQAVLKRYQQEK